MEYSKHLVRFTRSHDDDNDYVFSKFGPYPGSDAFVAELDLELSDCAFEIAGVTMSEPTLVELNVNGVDTDYRIYRWVSVETPCTPEALADVLQAGYDHSGVSGWFQIVGSV